MIAAPKATASENQIAYAVLCLNLQNAREIVQSFPTFQCLRLPNACDYALVAPLSEIDGVPRMAKRESLLRRALLAALVTCLCLLGGCFEWTEDSQGNLQSVGVPGVPIWQSKSPPTPLKPTDLGFTSEEASKISGPVLVMPTANSRTLRYRFYQTGQNHCQEDLDKMLTERAQQNATDPEPYCTDNPTAPSAGGNAGLF
jgi:hypothetical protein